VYRFNGLSRPFLDLTQITPPIWKFQPSGQITTFYGSNSTHRATLGYIQRSQYVAGVRLPSVTPHRLPDLETWLILSVHGGRFPRLPDGPDINVGRFTKNSKNSSRLHHVPGVSLVWFGPCLRTYLIRNVVL
jgi:hypothetical protein